MKPLNQPRVMKMHQPAEHARGQFPGLFTWDDIDDARNDRDLQRWHFSLLARIRYLLKSRRCPECGRGPWSLSWFYYRSPKWTWRTLCGRAGWMVVCDDCRVPVSFFVDVVN
jgi:hypothetical protein